MKQTNRRKFVIATAVTTVGLSGCVGGDNGGGNGGDDGGSNGEDNGESNGGDNGGSNGTEECALGGSTKSFDASGTPFVFTFDHPDVFEDPSIRELGGNSYDILMEIDRVGAGASVVLWQRSPNALPNELMPEEYVDDDAWEKVAETSFGDETVVAVSSEEGNFWTRLPHEKGGDNGIKVQVSHSAGTVFPCDIQDTRDAATRIFDSFEPNPDSTL